LNTTRNRENSSHKLK